MEGIKQGLARIGLGQPMPRGLAFAGAASAAFFITKPDIFFTASGQARGWSLLAGPNANNKTTTVLPWYVAAAGVGALGGMFL